MLTIEQIRDIEERAVQRSLAVSTIVALTNALQALYEEYRFGSIESMLLEEAQDALVKVLVA